MSKIRQISRSIFGTSGVQLKGTSTLLGQSSCGTLRPVNNRFLVTSAAYQWNAGKSWQSLRSGRGCLDIISPRHFNVTSIGLRPITSMPQDTKRERQLQKEKLEADPSEVTSTSSVRAIVEEAPAPPPDAITQKEAVKGGLQHDLDIIKETFAFREVPKEVLLYGGAGLIPYVVTTASTLFLAWDVRNIQEHGTGYLLDDQTAVTVLEFLEPVQVGFGAIILSFLGAIHWGLEFAAFGGTSPYRRYSLGILAPAFAWPTVFMPYDIALLTQFLGFTGMYFADARATTLGWAPRWYTSYRFLLTFIVGACIVVTLIGRGKIGDKANIAQTPEQRVSETRQSRRQGVEAETSGKEYQRLIKQEQELIRKKAEEEKQRTEEELAQKEEEYKKAKEASDRAAQRAGAKS